MKKHLDFDKKELFSDKFSPKWAKLWQKHPKLLDFGRKFTASHHKLFSRFRRNLLYLCKNNTIYGKNRAYLLKICSKTPLFHQNMVKNSDFRPKMENYFCLHITFFSQKLAKNAQNQAFLAQKHPKSARFCSK